MYYIHPTAVFVDSTDVRGLNSLLHQMAAVSNELHLVSCSLDKLLDSGLYTGEITELSGGPGSGKSQVNISYLPSPSLIISAS